MAMTPEGAVKAKVRKILQDRGAYYFMPPANGYGRVGIPDIICCHKGKFLAIECKAGKNKPTALQFMEMGAIRNAGGVALVINEDNLHTIAEALAELEKT
jgi:Holliday junction resolvase